MDGVFNFETDAGKSVNERGKVEWPHMIRVVVPHYACGRIIRELLVTLESGDSDSDRTLVFFGQLWRSAEEDGGNEIPVEPMEASDGN